MENIFVEFLPPWIETGLQPAFYDKESGTVLQQTARMYARVNMLIRMFNKLSKNTKTVVEDYINQFNELHDYVHDYFDNLDVQEEINNKLDAMVEDGTLQEIVADYLNSRAIFGFDTVADMKSATNLIDGSYAETLGYFTKNDGGSALYKIRTATNDDVIDERFIIEITGSSSDTLVAELVHGSEINVLKLGVTEINFADIVNELISNGYGVYIPKGEYVASETINITKNDSQLICDGNITGNVDVSPIFQVTGYRSVIKFNGNITATKDDGVNVNDIMWLGEYGKSSNYHNIYLHNASGFRNGIWCRPDNGFGVAWNKIRFDLLAGQCGILLQVGNTGTSYINENTFEGGRLNCNYGIKTVKGSQQSDPYNGNTFHNIAIDGTVTKGIELEYANYNYFDELRLSEGLQQDGLFIHIHSGSSNNSFSSKYRLKPSQFRDDNTASAARNYFNQLLVDDSGNYIGKQFHTQFGKIIMNRELLFDTQHYFLNLYGREDNDTYTEPIIYFDDIVVKCGNSHDNKTITLTLPEVFRNRGIRQFTYQIQYKEAGTSITLNDWQGNLIVDDAMLGVSGTKVTNLAKTIKYVGKAGNDAMPSEWIVV